MKPENVFFNKYDNKYKIGGLGLAAETEKNIMRMRDLVGTPFYMAVDIFTYFRLEQGSLTFAMDPYKNDIYALGVIAAELVLIQMDCDEIFSAKALYGTSKLDSVANLEHFLRLCEDKVKVHYLLLHILEYSLLTQPSLHQRCHLRKHLGTHQADARR